jgi:hypothetical protein
MVCAKHTHLAPCTPNMPPPHLIREQHILPLATPAAASRWQPLLLLLLLPTAHCLRPHHHLSSLAGGCGAGGQQRSRCEALLEPLLQLGLGRSDAGDLGQGREVGMEQMPPR